MEKISSSPLLEQVIKEIKDYKALKVLKVYRVLKVFKVFKANLFRVFKDFKVFKVFKVSVEFKVNLGTYLLQELIPSLLDLMVYRTDIILMA